MNKPLSTSKVFVFEKDHNIVYIIDSNGETIGYLAMVNKNDAEELSIIIKQNALDKQPKV